MEKKKTKKDPDQDTLVMREVGEEGTHLRVMDNTEAHIKGSTGDRKPEKNQ
ncbi:hypothetical protein [Heliorestis convoluta]|uniref:Uncharacterized protein n=1 Tax=Heliorestis convoluta TaxID=356322 RepID=A0A5Q2N1H7_9FIRM|nr:hypothetical protein [Heliorestis convoluta]QGG49224.1 hypothetical protein FTV88_3150 [Heliorestis convoluta]